MGVHSAVGFAALFLFFVVVHGQASNNSFVYGEGFYGVSGFNVDDLIASNTTYTFYIQAVDSNGNNITVGGDDFTVLFGYLSPDSNFTDNMDGTYTVSYILEPTMDYTGQFLVILVKLGSTRIALSDYLLVTPPSCLEPPYDCYGIAPISPPTTTASPTTTAPPTTTGPASPTTTGSLTTSPSSTTGPVSTTTGPASTTTGPASTTTGPASTTTGPASPTTGPVSPTTTGSASNGTTTSPVMNGTTTSNGVGPASNKSIVYGEGFYGIPGYSIQGGGGIIIANDTYTFYIQAIDSNGNNVTVGGENFAVAFALLEPFPVWTLTDNMDGTYTVIYQLDPASNPSLGEFIQIQVTLNGNSVAISYYLYIAFQYCTEPPYPCLGIFPTVPTTGRLSITITTSTSSTTGRNIPGSNDAAVPVVPIVVPISVVAVIAGVIGSACMVLRKKKRKDMMKWVALDQHMRRSDSSMADVALHNISPNIQRLFQLSDPSFALKIQSQALRFDENGRLCPVGKPISHEFSLTNTTSHQQSFFFQGRDTDKFKISFEPLNGLIKKGESATITAILVFKCTARVSAQVCLAVLDVGHVLLPLEVESELSARIDADELDMEATPVGEGGFGVVFRAHWRGMEVAVKTIKAAFSPVAREKFEGEWDMIAKLRHPNIVNFVGAVISPSMVAMVTEFCPLGTLHHLVTTTSLSYDLQTKFLLDIAKGMDFLHASGILHRDLKTDNVLVMSMNPDSLVCAKISDFGSSRTYDTVRPHEITGGIGTPTHMAPELLRGQGYTDKADVYSYAIVMYEVSTHLEPYDPLIFPMAWDVANFVVSGNRLDLPRTIDPRVTGLIRRCWSEDPTDRPDFGEIIYVISIMLGVSMPPPTPRKPLSLFIPPTNSSAPDQSAHTPLFFFPREGHAELTLDFASNISMESQSSTTKALSSSLEDSTCSSSGLPPSDSDKAPSSDHTAIRITPSDFVFSDEPAKEEPVSPHIKLPNEANTSTHSTNTSTDTPTNPLHASTISISVYE